MKNSIWAANDRMRLSIKRQGSAAGANQVNYDPRTG